MSHPRRQTHDYLDFGATVWIAGNGPLDVEGFRSDGSPTMKADQYFWRNGHVIGRVRAGTMGFASQQGHNHWHFEQFARYALLNSAKSLAVPSEKVGFCIAPSDPVNLRPVWSAVRARKPEPLPPKRVSYAWLPARQASTYRTLGSRTA